MLQNNCTRPTSRIAQSEFRKILRFRVVAEKSSLGAAEQVHLARAKYRQSKVGGGGGSSRTQYEKIRRFVQKSFFSIEYRDLEKSVDPHAY